ncbi:NADH-quinone oxidoreductase subunit NuoG [Candidatus Pandoraea novymonadis]|uniref:NADH-quinone oxidoreductase n=1 Tax=Candidatus Pandoraea novymonadis TaxID=1808959 RepID=A0ABX5FFB8_9BURK|nr:NADH-quinone oxidoreductase subunit NuoG [Candidatus Pandoraea novymonadis]PSB91852.1 NADH-quinone oxidoreductase chain 3 [Candidatus Pandoraea novymonadis]
MVEIEIDGQKVEVPEGSMVIQAAMKNGIYIPHFCYHKQLSIAANCRMCLVEVENVPKVVPACATPVAASMIVKTRSEKALKAQQSVMEFLLVNHPLDCPICDQGGECQLQDLSVGYGKTSSRYQEEKRVVFHKTAGPLISMEEMSRCIHCTRCVRFGHEIAGVMELGMVWRGERSEITSFVGKTVDSELSGNMIDLCPVGALTSKPFRYSARTWELSRRKSVSPHDSVGANLIVQVKNNRVMRVVPLENEAINECWISDKDRFSYEGLNSAERLTKPMLKQGGEWCEVDWQTALEYVVHGLTEIICEFGADAVAGVTTAHATVEELFLFQKIIRALGSDNIDFRLRQSDVSAPLNGVPWLGMSIVELSTLNSVLVIGSFLRKDHPLLATRIRTAVKAGAQLSVLHASDEDLLTRVANKVIVAPSAWPLELAGIAVAVMLQKGVAVPTVLNGIMPTKTAQDIAASLINGDRSAVFLGNTAVYHPKFAQLHSLAQIIADLTGANLGFLTEGANTLGGHVVKATNAEGVAALFEISRQAYLLLHAEPEFDAANPLQARVALDAAKMVVVMSPFRQGLDYADVLLPIAPFTETAGTFINAEGLSQHFNGVVRGFGETRPAWKVLRVLGNMLKLTGFDYDLPEQVRDAALSDFSSAMLDNRTNAPLDVQKIANDFGLERLADVPIYHADPLARRAPSLQMTRDAKVALRATLPTTLFDNMGLVDGDIIIIHQADASVTIPAFRSKSLPQNVVRIPSATPVSSAIGSMFGNISVEKA